MTRDAGPPGAPEDRDPDRRAELLGGAMAGDLDAQEQAELDALLARDPSAADELAELTQVMGALQTWGGTAPAPPPDLLDRVREAATTGAPAAAAPAPDVVAPTLLRPRPTAAPAARATGPVRWLGIAAAAALVFGLGSATGLLLGDGADDGGAGPVAGPPGTLGALERLDVDPVPEGVQAQAQLVAHTWGTETVLDMSGLPTDGAYEVALVTRDGSTAGAGSFVSTAGVVECRLNAGVLREDASRLVVRDTAGDVVLEADLPVV